MTANKQIREISLGDSFGPVVIKANHASVQIDADGTIHPPPHEAHQDNTPRPGDLIPGKGLYLGIWSPKDRYGINLYKTFRVYAAPYDLGLDENGKGKKLVLTYKKAVKSVAKIRNLMDHNGARFKDEMDLYDALRSGRYKGEWFIPTRDLMDGKDVAEGTALEGNKIQNDNLHQHHNTGKFAHTFAKFTGGFIPASETRRAHSYWSSSQLSGQPDHIFAVDVTDGDAYWVSKESHESRSLRLVRAEPVP